MTTHMVCEVRTPTAQTSEDLFEDARARLGVWGGASTSVARDEELNVSISFDPRTADGGVTAIFDWLDSLDVEYEARFSKWFD